MVWLRESRSRGLNDARSNASDEAIGIITPLHYSEALDNPANKKFVKGFREKAKKALGIDSVATAGRFMEVIDGGFLFEMNGEPVIIQVELDRNKQLGVNFGVVDNLGQDLGTIGSGARCSVLTNRKLNNRMPAMAASVSGLPQIAGSPLSTNTSSKSVIASVSHMAPA